MSNYQKEKMMLQQEKRQAEADKQATVHLWHACRQSLGAILAKFEPKSALLTVPVPLSNVRCWHVVHPRHVSHRVDDDARARASVWHECPCRRVARRQGSAPASALHSPSALQLPDASEFSQAMLKCDVGTTVLAVRDPASSGRFYVLGAPQFKIRDRSARACAPHFSGQLFIVGRVILKTPFNSDFLIDIEPFYTSHSATLPKW